MIKLLSFSLVIISISIKAFAEPSTSITAPTSDVSTQINSTSNDSKLTYDIYSESLSATYFDGAVNQSRLRLLHPIVTDKVQGYFGVNTSSDFTNDSTLRFADSFVSPTAGLLLKPLSFLGLFAEYRRLYRTVNNELPDQESDPRYGAYTYFFRKLPLTYSPHLELYGESVALQRFTTKPISTVWLKLGRDFQIQPERWTFTPYVEGFYRESPDLMLGIDERSLRYGGKLKWQWKRASLQMYGYRRFTSTSVPLGWEGFIVLAADGGLSWR